MEKLRIKKYPFVLILLLVSFSFGFWTGSRVTQEKIASRPSFDQEGFVKGVTKTITGRILEVKKDSLILTKADKSFVVQIDSNAKITLTKLAPISASPSGIASPGAAFLPPPEIVRELSLSELRDGDEATVTVTETPDGKLLGKVVLVQRK
jgi:hypothetical protein